MTLVEIIILGIALSIDAILVSFSFGLVSGAKRIKNSLMLSLSFGFFQFLMPVIGWYLSSFVYSTLKIFSKWIVFIVFMALAIKFIKEALSKKEEEVNTENISFLCILLLAIATSIDAMGAGISLKFSNVDILMPSIIIGIITFINSFFGYWIACLFKKFPGKYIEIFGAVLLIYLAIKAII